MAECSERALDAFHEEFVAGLGIDRLIGTQERALLQATQGSTGARIKYAAEDLAQSHGGPVMAGVLVTAALANSGPTMAAANAESVGRSGGTAVPSALVHNTRTKRAAQDRVVRLTPNEAIYNIAEVFAEQRGVSTKTEVRYIEQASNVHSEAEAEDLPVGFPVHIPAENDKAKTEYVSVPLGSNLTSTAGANGLTLRQLLQLNSAYRQHPNFVEAGARLRVSSPKRTTEMPTTRPHPHHESHSLPTPVKRSRALASPAAKPAAPKEPVVAAPAPRKTSVPNTSRATSAAPEGHPANTKARQETHSSVPSRPDLGLGTALQHDLSQVFTGAAASLAEGSHQLKQDTLHGVTATTQAITKAIAGTDKRYHDKSHGTAPTSNRGECTSTGHMSGKTPRQIAMNYFMICQRESVAQAAGVVGNLMQEDYGLRPKEIQNGGSSNNPADAGQGGWGIAQWTPGVKATNESKKYGIKGPMYTLQAQLALVSAEMKGQSPTGQLDMAKVLKQAKDPSQAAERFEQYFEEGPIASIGGGQLSNRQKYARQAAREFGGTALQALRSQGHWQSSGSHSHHTGGNAAIYYAALKYKPASYQETMIAGHEGVSQWHKDFPKIGPEAVIDCSGLVNLAVASATGGRVTLNENTKTERTDKKDWQEEPYSKVKRGDLIQPVIGNHMGNHVEIVNYVEGNKIYTFGAHTSHAPQPDQVGPAQYVENPKDVFLRYVGAGAPLGNKVSTQTSTKPPAAGNKHPKATPPATGLPSPQALAHAWNNPLALSSHTHKPHLAK